MLHLNQGAGITGIFIMRNPAVDRFCFAQPVEDQEWGKEPRELTPGDVVNIPAEVKHWHGAAPDSWFSHVAVEVPGTETKNEWCEPVSDEDYRRLK